MINHMYTLLLNERPAALQVPWARVIDPRFSPLELPAHLADTRAALVGRGSLHDRTYTAKAVLAIMNNRFNRVTDSWLDDRVTKPAIQPFYADFGVSVEKSVEDDATYGGVISTQS